VNLSNECLPGGRSSPVLSRPITDSHQASRRGIRRMILSGDGAGSESAQSGTATSYRNSTSTPKSWPASRR